MMGGCWAVGHAARQPAIPEAGGRWQPGQQRLSSNTVQSGCCCCPDAFCSSAEGAHWQSQALRQVVQINDEQELRLEAVSGSW